MKLVKWILIVLSVVIGITSLYLFKTELFYSEYWLQKKVAHIEQGKTNLKLSNRNLSYRFYHNMIVDLRIDLSDNGVIKLTYGDWISEDVIMSKELEYQLNPNTFEHLRSEFVNKWKHSYSRGADYKLGGTYYELTLSDHGSKQINISYDNVVPGDTLIAFKNQLIELANEVLKRK